MTAKNCNKCHELKPLSEFNKNIITKDGIQNICKACVNKGISHYRHTKKGLIGRIYGNQSTNSHNRNHHMPNYSLSELREWAFEQPIFHDIYDKWLESGYSKNSAPSFDRLDDYKPYTLDNLQIVTWLENYIRYSKDAINGINRKTSISVLQYTIKGDFVAEYHSRMHASRVTGVNDSGICACCSGRRKTSGGYIWVSA